MRRGHIWEGKGEHRKESVTGFFSVSLEPTLPKTNSLNYVGKTLIQFTHFLPCVKENAKPTSTH